MGDEIDLAARGVAPVEGALRPAQDLDPVDVEQLPRGLDRQRRRDFIDAHADGRGVVRGVVQEAYAADPILGLTTAEGRFHLQARYRVL